MLIKISNLSSFCPRLASGHLDKLAKKYVYKYLFIIYQRTLNFLL